MERWLANADWMLVALGLLVALIVLVRGAARLPATSIDGQSGALPIPPIEALFLPVVAYLGVVLVMYPLLRAAPPPAESDAAARPLDLAALFTTHAALAAGGAACWYVGRRWLRVPNQSFIWGPKRVGRDIRDGILGALVAIAMCQSLLFLTMFAVQWVKPDYEFPQHGVIDALRDPRCPAWLPVALWLGVTIVTPLAEELFFRGIMLGTLTRTLRRQWVAVIVAGCVFGLAHNSQPQVVPALSLFGIILGVIYLRTGSLVGPIIAHALFNAKTLLWEMLRATT